MPMDTSVKYFSSQDAGAPQLNRDAGSMVALLSACLTTGYGSVTLSTLTQTAGVATATVDAGHGYKDYSVIEITGATPAQYNGQQRIRVTSATQFTFEVQSGLASPASGTITARIPAAGGWEAAFTATNKAAFHSTDLQASGHYLRVDDDGHDGGEECRVRAYQRMTGIDAGTLPYPSLTDAPDALAWRKSDVSSARHWILLADPRTLVFLPEHRDGYAEAAVYYFGDIQPNMAADGDACALIGRTALNDSALSKDPLRERDRYTDTLSVQKNTLYNGSSLLGALISSLDMWSTGVWGSLGPDQWPMPPQHSFNVGRLMLVNEVGGYRVLRGALRGIADPFHADSIPEANYAMDIGGGIGPVRCRNIHNLGQLIFGLEKW